MDIAFLGLGEMFEGDSADICGGKYTLVSMGAERRVLCAQTPGERTPIGSSRNFYMSLSEILHWPLANKET